MLIELVVEDLGVISRLSLVLGPGMTALTGETGAGKTLVVTAIELLVGGRADATVVRPGAAEARIDGRFVASDGTETVLSRVVPASGRSRAYVDGRPAPVAALSEAGAALVDLHGQHAHQSLLGAGAQRDALDVYAGVDLGPLASARRTVAEIDDALAALGGDERTRAREIDLLGYQVEELDRATLQDADEESVLEVEEDVLAGATGHREAAALAHEVLAGDGGAAELVASALAALAGRAPFADVEARLRSAMAELTEAATDVRGVAEEIDTDPERLELVRARRQLLHELRRKYGETLAEVLAFAEEARTRLDELTGREARAEVLERRRVEALAAVDVEAGLVGAARRRAAPELAAAVQTELAALAMPRARVEVVVGADDPGDDVRFLLGANPGEALAPLAKVASGGELARTMLALRLVLGRRRPGAADDDAPQGAGTLVFDEVDAGIGGEAALAVGRSLGALGQEAQVLVVTHLPQVAAFADAQVAVVKGDEGARTVARVRLLDEPERVVELSRMLSGQPDSSAARDHAEELLAVAAKERGR